MVLVHLYSVCFVLFEIIVFISFFKIYHQNLSFSRNLLAKFACGNREAKFFMLTS